MTEWAALKKNSCLEDWFFFLICSFIVKSWLLSWIMTQIRFHEEPAQRMNRKGSETRWSFVAPRGADQPTAAHVFLWFVLPCSSVFLCWFEVLDFKKSLLYCLWQRKPPLIFLRFFCNGIHRMNIRLMFSSFQTLTDEKVHFTEEAVHENVWLLPFLVCGFPVFFQNVPASYFLGGSSFCQMSL